MWTLAALALLASLPPALPVPAPATPPAAPLHPGDDPEPVLERGLTEEAVPFGPFSVVTATRIPPADLLPILHGGGVYPSLSLRWRPANGRWRVELIDNGHSMILRAQGHACYLTSRYHHYTPAADEEPLFDQVQAAFARVVEDCPRVSAEEAAGYRAQFAAAGRADFERAFEEMKRRAVPLFRRLERCAFPPSEPGGPPPFLPPDGSCQLMR
jgi:hypothetical protein